MNSQYKRSPKQLDLKDNLKVKRGQCVSISATIKETKPVLRLYCNKTKLKGNISYNST